MSERSDMTKVLIIDGYIDEPASLGVPPYSSPQVRAVMGAVLAAEAKAELLTIDQIRKGAALPRTDLAVIMAGCAVPGRYLRGMPASGREIADLARRMEGYRVLGGPAALETLPGAGLFDQVAKQDAAASCFDLIEKGVASDRWRSVEEWNHWLLLGAESVLLHPDFPQPLIAEIETYRGCVRYRSGGCSFCIEPLKGRPVHRLPLDIIAEVRRLRELGVRNFRLGAQTCFISYMAEEEGSEVPRPNPAAIEELLSGISSQGVEVLHLDNANPAVMAAHPEETGLILESIVRHCTSGNVLALGLESADPAVQTRNNLNADADQTMAAIRLINRAGRERGASGLPKVLPGLNFIIGLDGETADTLRLDREFLTKVWDEGLLLRRINIRQVSAIRRGFEDGVTHSQFLRFKQAVREEVDRPMLRQLAPVGTILRGVYMELREGKHTFGRQIGTYPLLIGFNYPLEIGRFVDCKVVDYGFRSLTAVEFPLDLNRCPIAAIQSLPGIGNKRAVRLFRGRPYRSWGEVAHALDEPSLVEGIAPFLVLG
jgi:radical SAM superfamily enzyme with C-terminal helix-hairpin-helix motif